MPVRVGIDLVDVAAVASSLATFGAAYSGRVYTAGELRDVAVGGMLAPERLAGRFAAKEAALKVLAPGDDAVPWRDIEVRTSPGGAPSLQLSGAAEALAARVGIAELAVSMTHENGTAAAVVVGVVGHGLVEQTRGSRGG